MTKESSSAINDDKTGGPRSSGGTAQAEPGRPPRLATQIQRCGAFCEEREKTDRNKDTRHQREERRGQARGEGARGAMI